MELIYLLAAYAALGLFAGVVAGLLGVGGGLIIVPVLAGLFALQGFSADYLVQLAVGSSLATIVFTSMSSAWAHARHGAVRWRLVAQLAVGILLGAWFGGRLAVDLGGARLAMLFGLFEIGVALYMLLGRPPLAHRRIAGPVRNATAGGIIGLVSALLGIGGGTMTVPWLVWHKLSMREAVATSSACGLPIALVGALGFMWAGRGLQLPTGSTGLVFWPAVIAVSTASVLSAPLGARWAHRIDQLALKRIFAVFLMFLGGLMIAKSLLSF